MVSLIVFLALFPATIFAAEPGPSDRLLRQAVKALEKEEYERSLELLDKAAESGADARVWYYRGYALEKTGACDAARTEYSRAVAAEGAEKLNRFAIQALRGFDERCQPAAVEEIPYEAPLGAGRVGWKVFGWTTTILGAVALGAVPIKGALEDDGFERAAPYFKTRYGCEVDRLEIGGENCNETGLQKDPIYQEYETRAETAKQTSDYMLMGGIGLATVGVGTLLTVAFTRPSVDVAVAPSDDGGVQVGASFRF